MMDQMLGWARAFQLRCGLSQNTGILIREADFNSEIYRSFVFHFLDVVAGHTASADIFDAEIFTISRFET